MPHDDVIVIEGAMRGLFPVFASLFAVLHQVAAFLPQATPFKSPHGRASGAGLRRGTVIRPVFIE